MLVLKYISQSDVDSQNIYMAKCKSGPHFNRHGSSTDLFVTTFVSSTVVLILCSHRTLVFSDLNQNVLPSIKNTGSSTCRKLLTDEYQFSQFKKFPQSVFLMFVYPELLVGYYSKTDELVGKL